MSQKLIDAIKKREKKLKPRKASAAKAPAKKAEPKVEDAQGS